MKRGKLFLILLCFLAACRPEQVGFLNEHMRYNVAVLQVVQGTTVSTPPLIANGSTSPMNVELLEVRNKATGERVSDFSVEKDISIYLAQIGADDNTLEKINAKIGTKPYAAISVNHIGGMVTLSPATEDIAPGVYTIDLQITNVAGTKVIKEALDINLLPMKADSIFASSANTSKIGLENVTTAYTNYDVSIQHISNGPNKIIYMWLDKDGKVFNPADGEVIKRPRLPSFKDWSPYYPEELTDTAIVYEFPYHKGLTYPLKSNTIVNGENYATPAVYYRVVSDATDTKLNYNTSTTARFYKAGTHIIRFKLKDVKQTNMPNITETVIVNNVTVPFGAGYAGTPVNIDETQLSQLFGMPSSEIPGKIGTDILFYAVEKDGNFNSTNTASPPGHWFDVNGNVVNWGEPARLYCEYNKNNFLFNIGQFPDKNVAGDFFLLRQAMVYDKTPNERVQVIFQFNVKVE